MPGTDKVLVIQPLPGIGDMVWFVPHLRAIAAAESGRISLLTKARTQSDLVLKNEAIVEEFIWIDDLQYRRRPLKSIAAIAAGLKARRFAQVWILHHSPRYGLITALAGIKARYGYAAGTLQRLFLTTDKLLPSSYRRACRIECASKFLGMHGLTPTDRPLAVDPHAAADVRARFADIPQPWIGFGIGSSDPRRRWPMQHFARLAAQLDPDARTPIFLCASGQERAVAERIAVEALALGRKVIPATDLPLTHTMALIRQCALFVGNDSGLLNLAAALGTQTVGLFGCGALLPPRPNLHAVTPPPGGLPSMERISVERVTEFIARHGLVPGC